MMPPIWLAARRCISQKMPRNRPTGSSSGSRAASQLLSVSVYPTSMSPWPSRTSVSAAGSSVGPLVLNSEPSVRVPVTEPFVLFHSTLRTLSSATSLWNWFHVISSRSVRGMRLGAIRTTKTSATRAQSAQRGNDCSGRPLPWGPRCLRPGDGGGGGGGCGLITEQDTTGGNPCWHRSDGHGRDGDHHRLAGRSRGVRRPLPRCSPAVHILVARG